jgi:formate-dependent nitrite reductase membrane component NrfD
MSHANGPPPEELARRDHAAQPHAGGSRDTTPAVGTRGQAGAWQRAREGASVALHQRSWRDARWSYLFGRGDTSYRARAEDVDSDRVAAAAHRMREGEEVPDLIQGPMMHSAVWTWEVPLYFWFGGIASGSAWAAFACDIVGDHDSAKMARRVSLGAALPCAPLLIKDLGRPARFLNMMRIFKPRSPMSMGAWCLAAFSSTAGGSVVADLLGWRREARALGAASAALGMYLGSYTGILLASTAVPVWARSRMFLPPIFVCTAAAKGAAATRLVLAATGTEVGHPSRSALGTVETVAMASELALSSFNERRLGRFGHALDQGDANKLFEFAKWSVRGGLALRFARKRGGPWVHHLASVMYLSAGLAFRFAWVAAGRNSAQDDEAVARMARTKAADIGREVRD